MSRQKKSKILYQPDVGVKQDFEELLHKFSELGTVRYEAFAEVWRDMKMSLYCAGRQSQKEAREFVEECFHIAVQFWLPPSSFLVRVGAVYLLYGLFNFQLVIPKAKIRITPEQWLTILEFQDEVREEQHLDLDYVFQKMIMEKAFIFVAMPKELYPAHRDQEEGTYIPESLKEENYAIDEIFSSSALNQLALVDDQYNKMKVALNSEGDAPDRSLSIVHSDWIANIYRTLKSFKEKRSSVAHTLSAVDSKDEDNKSNAESSISKKKKLKNKAFGQTASSYRGHRRKVKEQSSDNDSKNGDDDDEKDDDEDYKPPKKMEVDELEGPVIRNSRVVWTNRRGREKVQDLYEKDDIDLEGGKGSTGVQDTLSMPDLPDYDQLERNLHLAQEHKRLLQSSESDNLTEDDSAINIQGKAPAKGKANVKKEKSAAKNQSKPVKRKSEPVKGCKLKTLKVELSDIEDYGENKTSKRSRSKNSNKGGRQKEDEVTVKEIKEQKHSAQKQLQEKLNQRKKIARKGTGGRKNKNKT